jgi:hypothetical protein
MKKTCCADPTKWDKGTMMMITRLFKISLYFFHYQPINAPTAGAQDFLYRLTGHNPPHGPSAGCWVLTIANATGANSSTCLPKHRGARDNKFLVTHPMTDLRCLTSAIARQSAMIGPSSSFTTNTTIIQLPNT